MQNNNPRGSANSITSTNINGNIDNKIDFYIKLQNVYDERVIFWFPFSNEASNMIIYITHNIILCLRDLKKCSYKNKHF